MTNPVWGTSAYWKKYGGNKKEHQCKAIILKFFNKGFGVYTLSEICDNLKFSQQTILINLNKLEKEGLITYCLDNEKYWLN